MGSEVPSFQKYVTHHNILVWELGMLRVKRKEERPETLQARLHHPGFMQPSRPQGIIRVERLKELIDKEDTTLLLSLGTSCRDAEVMFHVLDHLERKHKGRITLRTLVHTIHDLRLTGEKD